MDNLKETINNLKNEYETYKQEEKSKDIFVKNLKISLDKEVFLPKINITPYKENITKHKLEENIVNSLEADLLNKLEEKEIDKETLLRLQSINKDVKLQNEYYSAIYGTIEKEHKKNTLTEDKIIYLNHFFTKDNEDKDLVTLKHDFIRLTVIEKDDTLKKLDLFNLRSYLDKNKTDYEIISLGILAYVNKAIGEGKFNDLYIKKNLNKEEYKKITKATYKDIPEDKLEEIKKEFKGRFEASKAKWDNLDKDTQKHLQSFGKMIVNGNENKKEIQSAYILRNFLETEENLRDLDKAYINKKIKSKESKIINYYDDFLENSRTNSAINRTNKLKLDMDDVLYKAKVTLAEDKEILNKEQTLEKPETQLQDSTLKIREDKEYDIDKDILTASDSIRELIKQIPDKDLVRFTRNFYEINNHNFTERNILENGELKDTIFYNGTSYSKEDFRTLMENNLINEAFFAKDYKHNGTNLQNLFENRYELINYTNPPRYHYKEEALKLVIQGKPVEFNFPPKGNIYGLSQSEYADYVKDLNDKRDLANSNFSEIINKYNMLLETYKTNKKSLDKEIQDKVKELQKDGITFKLLNLAKNKMVLIPMMLFNFPLAIGILAFSVIANVAKRYYRKIRLKQLSSKVSSIDTRFNEEKEKMEKAHLKSFSVLNDKSNSFDFNYYKASYNKDKKESNKIDEKKNIYKELSKKGTLSFIYLPNGSLDNYKALTKDNNTNSIIEIPLEKVKGDSIDDKLKSRDNFYKQIEFISASKDEVKLNNLLKATFNTPSLKVLVEKGESSMSALNRLFEDLTKKEEKIKELEQENNANIMKLI